LTSRAVRKISFKVKMLVYEGQVWFEEYMLTYQYRYNRYLSICGGSVLKEWTLQYPNPSHKKISSLVEESGNPLPDTS
jgi:hypothetical protein